MTDPLPTTLDALDRLAAVAETYVDDVIAGLMPEDARQLAAAWDAIYTREVLVGTLLSIVVTWTHPAGWVCLDLAGGPGPLSSVLCIPLRLRLVRSLVQRLCASQAVIYVDADFFTWSAHEQFAHFITVAREQQPQESTP